MTGHEERYQNGFDCQGLWVEVEVEKDLGLKSKRDIENLVQGDREKSIAKFVQLCKERVNKFARTQTEQSIRLGYWMDWDRSDADWAKAKTQTETLAHTSLGEARPGQRMNLEIDPIARYVARLLAARSDVSDWV